MTLELEKDSVDNLTARLVDINQGQSRVYLLYAK